MTRRVKFLLGILIGVLLVWASLAPDGPQPTDAALPWLSSDFHDR